MFTCITIFTHIYTHHTCIYNHISTKHTSKHPKYPPIFASKQPIKQVRRTRVFDFLTVWFLSITTTLQIDSARSFSTTNSIMWLRRRREPTWARYVEKRREEITEEREERNNTLCGVVVCSCACCVVLHADTSVTTPLLPLLPLLH